MDDSNESQRNLFVPAPPCALMIGFHGHLKSQSGALPALLDVKIGRDGDVGEYNFIRLTYNDQLVLKIKENGTIETGPGYSADNASRRAAEQLAQHLRGYLSPLIEALVLRRHVETSFE